MTLRQAIKKATYIAAAVFIAGDVVYLKTTRVEALQQLNFLGLLDIESNSDGDFYIGTKNKYSQYPESIGTYDADNNDLILGS